ncbi:hypothetical protein [Erythrobacter sp. EC-HK427]|uniref:hypothetical protein n=1 Tax=Erythrobacter sp. EC-HK427 TaxID=2038396 RepID=UPI001259BC5A|nr:hypothetical protein [Erythrobacter sp. EC-HK427]VVT10173.1 conserved hypothetical protein [Erythrobacter sp. EC-HK427]
MATALPFLAATPSIAQNTITVQGESIETADVRSTAREITVGSFSAQFPLARFQRPVCPGVWGMTEENAQAVLDRIVFNALEADIPVSDEPDCGANVWVIVVEDANATFEQLLEEDSFLTRHLTRFQLRQVRGEEGAARGWNLISTRNPATGVTLPDGFYMASEFQEALTRGPITRGSAINPPVNERESASRLELAIRTDIELSVVLVERAALAEIDSHALADYATMRLLAHTQPPEGEGSVATVLRLFAPGAEGGSAQQRMTEFDRAYLRALYRSSPVRPGYMALGNIAGAMETIETP